MIASISKVSRFPNSVKFQITEVDTSMKQIDNKYTTCVTDPLRQRTLSALKCEMPLLHSLRAAKSAETPLQKIQPVKSIPTFWDSRSEYPD